MEPYPILLKKWFLVGLNRFIILPSFSFKLKLKWVCSPLPATPSIGLARNVTSNPFLLKVSLTKVLINNSLSAACIASENFQSISNCSIIWSNLPEEVSLALTPPTSLCPISGSNPYSSIYNKLCSKAVLTLPLVLVQYCSCKTWEVESSSIKALSFGVLTQNSNSVADVNKRSSISSNFIFKSFSVSGYFFNNENMFDLNVSIEFFNICLESTALSSWIKKQGILSVPTGLLVKGSIKS